MCTQFPSNLPPLVDDLWFNYEDDRDFETEVYAYEKYNETFTTSLVRKDEDLEVIGMSKKEQSSSHQNTQLMQLPNQPAFFNQQDGNQPAPPTQPSPVQQEAADATDEEDESMELTAGEMDVTNQQLGGDTTQPQQGDTLPSTNQDDTLDGMLDGSQ